MAKKQTIPNHHDERTRLTPEEAAQVADSWINFFCDDETIGDLLLLLLSICYEPDATEREALVIAVENTLMPYSPHISTALQELVSSRLAVAHSMLREGGTQ
jgi:hypothetical protein